MQSGMCTSPHVFALCQDCCRHTHKTYDASCHISNKGFLRFFTYPCTALRIETQEYANAHAVLQARGFSNTINTSVTAHLIHSIITIHKSPESTSPSNICMCPTCILCFAMRNPPFTTNTYDSKRGVPDLEA